MPLKDIVIQQRRGKKVPILDAERKCLDLKRNRRAGREKKGGDRSDRVSVPLGALP